MSTVKPVSPLNLDRYELKYRIPIHQIEPITDYVNQYCEMDYFSQISPEGYYIINSLYLDSMNYFMMRRKLGIEMAYSSFRIRSYGADPKPPYYLESKQKMENFCKKRRSKFPFENIADLFADPTSIQGLDPYADKNMRDYIEKHQLFGLEPKILTQYRRRAWLSRHDEYARVTIDRDLRYMEENTYNVKPDEKRMSHYDHNETFEELYGSRYAILELKCERKIPLWMQQIVRTFEVQWDPFSKFRSGMYECYGRKTELFAHDVMSHHATSAHLDQVLKKQLDKVAGGRLGKLIAAGE